jgi:hypothetical protein
MRFLENLPFCGFSYGKHKSLIARSGDPFAAQRLLGHADLKMAIRYAQDVPEQTDRVIENIRKYVI